MKKTDSPLLRKELWGGEFWSDGYYVSTVGKRGDWRVVERYVKDQGKVNVGYNLNPFVKARGINCDHISVI